MLRGISPVLSPELLYRLAQMGHGDEIVLADSLFPAHSLHNNVIRMDGVSIPTLLNAMMPHFAVDTYSDDSVLMVTPELGDAEEPDLPNIYRRPIDKYCPEAPATSFTNNRFEFYERAKNAYCIVVTGSVVKYGNLLLKKGVY